MKSKVKILTIQFDITELPQEVIDELILSVEVQGEIYDADVFNRSVREVDTEDV